MPSPSPAVLAVHEVDAAQVPRVTHRVLGLVEDRQGWTTPERDRDQGSLTSFFVLVPGELKSSNADKSLANLVGLDVVLATILSAVRALIASSATHGERTASSYPR